MRSLDHWIGYSEMNTAAQNSPYPPSGQMSPSQKVFPTIVVSNWPIMSTHPLFNFTVAFITSWDYFAYLFPCLSLGSLHENRYHDSLSLLWYPQFLPQDPANRRCSSYLNVDATVCQI